MIGLTWNFTSGGSSSGFESSFLKAQNTGNWFEEEISKNQLINLLIQKMRS